MNNVGNIGIVQSFEAEKFSITSIRIQLSMSQAEQSNAHQHHSRYVSWDRFILPLFMMMRIQLNIVTCIISFGPSLKMELLGSLFG